MEESGLKILRWSITGNREFQAEPVPVSNPCWGWGIT
jgi:hypothetical protein